MTYLSSKVQSFVLVALFYLSGSVTTSEAFITSASTIRRNECLPPASRVFPNSFHAAYSTTLYVKKELSNAERGSDNVNNLIGIDRGLYLFAIVMAINVWFFSVPVEFRRTRICNEEDSAAYPTKCMTGKQFRTGVSDYYKNGERWPVGAGTACVETRSINISYHNFESTLALICMPILYCMNVASKSKLFCIVGGGIKFDFSIEGRE